MKRRNVHVCNVTIGSSNVDEDTDPSLPITQLKRSIMMRQNPNEINSFSKEKMDYMNNFLKKLEEQNIRNGYTPLPMLPEEKLGASENASKKRKTKANAQNNNDDDNEDNDGFTLPKINLKPIVYTKEMLQQLPPVFKKMVTGENNNNEKNPAFKKAAPKSAPIRNVGKLHRVETLRRYIIIFLTSLFLI